MALVCRAAQGQSRGAFYTYVTGEGMPHISIRRGSGGLEVDVVDTGARAPTQEEIIRSQMAEAARLREEGMVTRVIQPEETAPESLKCNDCGFVAGSAQGLTSHRRNKHPKV